MQPQCAKKLSECLRGATSLTLVLATNWVLAQPYPIQPIRLIVPWPPGGGVDTSARIVAQPLSQRLGQNIVIENRPGAGGNIGTELAAKAKPDGYTLLMGSVSPNAINIHLYPKLAFEPLKDFEPIGYVTEVPNILVVPGNASASTAQELIAQARINPGKLNYGTAGVGSSQHLAAAMLIRAAQIDIVHVPYKGTGPLTQALLTGEVSAANIGLGLVLNHVQDGRLVGLAISGPRNEGVLPAVPDVGKIVPGSEFVSWQALFVPARTPRAAIDKLNAVLLRVVAAPEIKARMQETGMATVTSTPAEMAKIVADDLANYRDLVRRLGLKPN